MNRAARTRTSWAAAAVLVALAAAWGSLAARGAAERPPPAQIYVSPTGSDSSPCTEKGPCASFDRAYKRAQPGQVVEVRAGRYPGQTISSDPAKTSEEDVVFRPAKGARVELTGILVVLGSHVEVRGMHGTAWKSQGGDDQTFRNMDVDILFIQGSSRVSVIGGDVGPLQDHDSQVTSFGGRPPSQILFDRVYFHDARKTDPSAHTECLQFGAGVDVVIRRSRFQRCADHDILVRSWGELNGSQHPLRNWTIENNLFDKTLRGHYSLRLAFKEGWPCENFLVRNNSALQNMYSDCEAKSVRFLANIQPTKSRFSCTAGRGSAWDWNVYSAGAPCGPHDTVAAPGFRAASSLDLHLVRGAAAVGHGDPGSVPKTDIDGERRPQGGRPDAGADER